MLDREIVRTIPGCSMRSVGLGYHDNTVTIDDADRHLTIRVRFGRPHAIPQIDAARPRWALETYLYGGTGALKSRFSHATVEVR